MQVRCLLEGVQPGDILAQWHTLLTDYMDKWDLDRQEVPPLPPSSSPHVRTCVRTYITFESHDDSLAQH